MRVEDAVRQIQLFPKDDMPQEHHVLAHQASVHVVPRRPWPLGWQIRIALRGCNELQGLPIETVGAELHALPRHHKMRTTISLHSIRSRRETAPKDAVPELRHRVGLPR